VVDEVKSADATISSIVTIAEPKIAAAALLNIDSST
jgi:hypothetical protein